MSKTTIYLTTALEGGYIGEVLLLPKTLTNAIRAVRGLPLLTPIILYYYGEKNNRLRKKFGFPTVGDDK